MVTCWCVPLSLCKMIHVVQMYTQFLFSQSIFLYIFYVLVVPVVATAWGRHLLSSIISNTTPTVAPISIQYTDKHQLKQILQLQRLLHMSIVIIMINSYQTFCKKIVEQFMFEDFFKLYLIFSTSAIAVFPIRYTAFSSYIRYGTVL